MNDRDGVATVGEPLFEAVQGVLVLREDEQLLVVGTDHVGGVEHPQELVELGFMVMLQGEGRGVDAVDLVAFLLHLLRVRRQDLAKDPAVDLVAFVLVELLVLGDVARQRQEVAVDRVDLVGEGIHDAGVDREEGVELVGDADAFGFGAEEEGSRVAVEGVGGASHLRQRGELFGGQGSADLASRGRCDPFDEHPAAEGSHALDLDKLVGLEAGDHVARGEFTGLGSGFGGSFPHQHSSVGPGGVGSSRTGQDQDSTPV